MAHGRAAKGETPMAAQMPSWRAVLKSPMRISASEKLQCELASRQAEERQTLAVKQDEEWAALCRKHRLERKRLGDK